MIDIPLGKALVPVECGELNMSVCKKECYLYGSCKEVRLHCFKIIRKDKKNVIFKLVDYPVGEKK